MSGAGGRGPGGAADVVVFDLDGVLTRRDTFAGLVARRLVRSPLRLALALAIAPLMAAPPTRRTALRLLTHLALVGLTTAGYRAAAAAHAARLAADPRAIHPECVAEARAHRARGARVVFATASEQALARALLDRVGLADVELVASRLRRVGRRWQVEVHNHGAEKPRQLARIGIDPPWQVAYSDAEYDLPLLAGARAAVLVNPSPAFERRARRELPGDVRTVRWGA